MFSHAGELRWRCRFLEPKQHRRAPSGFVREEYRVWAEEPCKIEDAVGTEAQSHDQRDASQTVLVTVRYQLPRLPKVTDVVELLDDTGRILNITSVRDPDQLRRQLEIYCRGPG